MLRSLQQHSRFQKDVVGVRGRWDLLRGNVVVVTGFTDVLVMLVNVFQLELLDGRPAFLRLGAQIAPNLGTCS